MHKYEHVTCQRGPGFVSQMRLGDEPSNQPLGSSLPLPHGFLELQVVDILCGTGRLGESQHGIKHLCHKENLR